MGLENMFFTINLFPLQPFATQNIQPGTAFSEKALRLPKK
jgi:hypothetical protein